MTNWGKRRSLMLRSIADIARSEGEDLSSLDTRLACVTVFALGGRTERDNATETAYYAVRAALTRALSEAAEFIAQRGIAEEGTPIVIRVMTNLASRFGIIVTDKMAAELVPILGALGGASINLVFIRHFQTAARGHFIVRRLERKYGGEFVKKEYEKVVRGEWSTFENLLDSFRFIVSAAFRRVEANRKRDHGFDRELGKIERELS
jgi:hypothetical protein